MANSNLDKLKKIMVDEPESSFEVNERARIENEEWLEDSFKVAVLVLRTLRQRQMTQKALADLMGVTAQQVNKIVKGKENLQFGTVKKIERALGLRILKVCEPESYFLVNISSGKTEQTYPIKSQAAEETYSEAIAKGTCAIINSAPKQTSYNIEELSSSFGGN